VFSIFIIIFFIFALISLPGFLADVYKNNCTAHETCDCVVRTIFGTYECKSEIGIRMAILNQFIFFTIWFLLTIFFYVAIFRAYRFMRKKEALNFYPQIVAAPHPLYVQPPPTAQYNYHQTQAAPQPYVVQTPAYEQKY